MAAAAGAAPARGKKPDEDGEGRGLEEKKEEKLHEEQHAEQEEKVSVCVNRKRLETHTHTRTLVLLYIRGHYLSSFYSQHVLLDLPIKPPQITHESLSEPAPALEREEVEEKPHEVVGANLQRQDSYTRGLRSILKKSRSTSSECETGSERTDAPGTRQEEEQEEEEKGDAMEKMEDDREVRLVKRASSSCSDEPRSPSVSTSEGEEPDSSSSGNQRYAGL